MIRATHGLPRLLSRFLNNPQNTVFHIDNITSHDLTLGLRWMLQPEAPAPIYPLVRKG